MDNSLSQYFNNATPGDGILTEIYAGTLMSENSVDYIIPDYVADADKILLCTAVPKIEGKFISGNTVELEGTVYFYLLLATEGNTLSSLVYSEPFESKAVVEGLSDECFVSLNPRMEYTTARLVNPRKVNLRYQVNTDMRVFCNRILEPAVSGTQSLDDDMNLQRHYLTLRTADTASGEEKNIPASQDIELDSNYPQVQEIILCKVRLLPGEVKARNGETDIRTEAVMNCIYQTEEGNYFCVDKKFFLEKTLSGIGAEGFEWSAKAVAGTVNAKPATNSYGEMKIIELDFTYDLEVTGIRNREMEAVCDMYSTEYECDCDFSSVGVTVFRRSYGTSLSVNAGISRDEISAEKVKNVFSGAVNLKNTSVQYNSEKNKLIAEGIAEIHLVGENNILVENEILFSPYTFEYPFKCEIDAGEDLKTAEFLTDCTVSDVRFRADSQNLYADFEVGIRVTALDNTPVRYLSTIKLDRDTPVTHTNAPITLCYPSGKETLWDIAKYYKITSDSILVSNSMTSEDIGGRKVLLIPRSQPKRPIFSKVI